MQLDELYRQVIMDHYQHPRNQGEIQGDAMKVDLKNPTCGDEIHLQLAIEDDVVHDVRFKGAGCSISMSSASMMTEAIKGKPLDEALLITAEFKKMIRGEAYDEDALGDLERCREFRSSLLASSAPRLRGMRSNGLARVMDIRTEIS